MKTSSHRVLESHVSLRRTPEGTPQSPYSLRPCEQDVLTILIPSEHSEALSHVFRMVTISLGRIGWR